MAILYAFDGHKNRVAFNGDTDIPITVPMQLPDGSVIFYDRVTSYGTYKINSSGYPERITGAVDDGSAGSRNWRYLICEQADLDDGAFQWGPYDTNEGLDASDNQNLGAGLPNTEAMISKYGDNDTYLWKLIKEKRDKTGLKWFMPSKDELNMMYGNRTSITNEGGDAFKTDVSYWSSSENNSATVWGQFLSNGIQGITAKDESRRCRLVRRI